MSVIEPLLRQPAAQAIGWALLHFLWQGTLVAAVAAVLLSTLRHSAADVRYVVASIALALMLTMPAVTALQMFQSIDRSTTSVLHRSDAVTSAPEVQTARPAREPIDVDRTVMSAPSPVLGPRSSVLDISPLLPTFMLVWVTGVCLLSLRLLTGWWWIHRLRTHGVAPASAHVQRVAARLARKLHISGAVTLLESALVEVPTVVGWLKPIVLLPASALAGLSPGQLEAILAHEFAHIRRHDYLVNLLQTFVETLLFYHPAVWWLSRRIRHEREHCCDDLAVALCGDPVAYAGALADLEDLASVFRRKPLLPRKHLVAADGGSLLHRIRRLLGAPDAHDTHGPAWFGGGVAILLLGGAVLAAQARQTPATTPASAAPGAVAAATVTSPAVASTPAFAPAAIAPATPAAASTAPQGRADDPAMTMAAAAARTLEAADALQARAFAMASTPAMAADARAPMEAAAARVEEGSQSIHNSQHGSSGNWVWSHNGEKLAVRYNGEFEFTDEDADVKWISPGGSLEISDAALFGRHTVEIRDAAGGLQRRYWVNGMERPYEPEGRQWLHDHLPQFVRNTGIGAERRVARLLKSGGPAAVLTEIGRIDGDYVKGVYYTQLFKQATLDPPAFRQALAQAGRDLHSDYSLATLLISLVDRLPADEPSRGTYFEAARGIRSDYELHRVYTALLKRGPVGASLLAKVLQNTSTIGSDYELSQLLQQIVAQQPLDSQTRGPFFAAVDTLGSDYERHRVLKAVVSRPGADDATIAAALQAAATGSSDYERASFLLETAKARAIDGAARAPFFTALGRVQSSYERGRVLQAIVRQPNVSHDVLLSALQSAKGITSGYELAQLLTAVADTHTLTGDLREAYLDAADRLQGYDQGRVMTALVKSERRK